MNASRAAFGCLASMVFELIYHRWSPTYRRGFHIEDPLHVDTLNLNDRSYPENMSHAQLKRIETHRNEHHSAGFRWPYSTHICLHGAACNGILAGLVGITAGLE